MKYSTPASTTSTTFGSGFLLVSLLLLSAPVTAQAPSTIRVTCDDSAAKADITVNGEFRGECPIDVQTAPGTVTIEASKTVAGKKQVHKEQVRIGSGTTKRIEVSFSAAAAGPEPAAQAYAPSAEDVARLRHEAALQEWQKNINQCVARALPEYRRQLQQELRRAEQEHRAVCIEKWGEYRDSCGGWDDYSFSLLKTIRETRDTLSYRADEGWCREQFPKPTAP